MRRELLVFLAALSPGLAEAGVPCPDLALVMAIDVSGSVDDREHRLQVSGIAAAFRDDHVLAAIESAGKVSVAAVFWADRGLPVTRVDWVDVDTRADAERFAAAVESAPRLAGGSTGLGRGLWAALDLVEERPCATRKVVNLSGDGSETVSPRYPKAADGGASSGADGPRYLHDSRLRAEAMGVTVNALAITNAEPWLAEYFERSLITGHGAFVMEIDSYLDFAEAIRIKLEREIQPALAMNGRRTLALASARTCSAGRRGTHRVRRNGRPRAAGIRLLRDPIASEMTART